jgi:cobyrinic acid a,c-diamide synthase
VKCWIGMSKDCGRARLAEGLIIAAPSSGSGKTVVTLAILRALRRLGVNVASAKAGPDYIDPRFHEAATSKPCLNLDPWAMRPAMVKSLLAKLARDTELVIVEGVMGLFDGAENAQGSTADLAAATGLPVVLVVDASRQAQSVAALVHGFKTWRKDINLAAVILNRVGSPRHAEVLKASLQGIPVIGALPRLDHLELPSRHLGLVQADELETLEVFLEQAADAVAEHLDLGALPSEPVARFASISCLPPLAQTMAIARDEAFGFFYAHLAESWRAQGAELKFFSPLADQPAPHAQAIYLPGGYPELHAEKLAAATNFRRSLLMAADKALIYGECGGYMVLGDAIIDAKGRRHTMTGLLPVTTSFEKRKLHLGYRRLSHNSALPWPSEMRGHEFHYSTAIAIGEADALFHAMDSRNAAMGEMGLKRDRVMGSYAHVIDAEPS